MDNRNLTIVEVRIRLCRALKDLTQKELAKILNVSRGLVNSWENGYADISLKNLVAMAYYFKVPVDYLLGLTTYYDSSIYHYTNNIDKEFLGAHIRIIRKVEKLNQKKFSEIVHIGRASLSHYEQGKIMMSSNNLKEICSTFGYSADWCLGNTNTCIRRGKKISIKQEEYNVFQNI